MEAFVLSGPDAGRVFPLSASSVIGRDPTAAVRLSDEEVSRRHAIVLLGEGEIVVEDLGSVNGTFTEFGQVNKEKKLMAGDRIRVGRTVIEIRDAPARDLDAHEKTTKSSLPRL